MKGFLPSSKKVGACLCTLIIVTSVFMSAFSGADIEAKDEDPSKGPSSKWDLNFYFDKKNKTFYANSPTFKVQFNKRLSSDDLCNMSTKDESITFSPRYLYESQGLWKEVQNVTGKRDGTALIYEGAFGEGIDLHHENCLNGVKETLVFQEKVNVPSDLKLISHIDPPYENASLETEDGKEITTTKVKTRTRLKDADSEGGGFIFGKAVALESYDPSRPFANHSKRSNAQSLSYSLLSRPDHLTHVVYIPKTLLTGKDVKYPISVDPSLGPTISDYQSYSDQEIDVTDQIQDGVDVELLVSSSMEDGDNIVMFWTEENELNDPDDPWVFYILEARSNRITDSYWDRTAPHTGVYIYRAHGTDNDVDLSESEVDIVGILTVDSGHPNLYRMPEWLDAIIPEGVKVLEDDGDFFGLIYNNGDDDITIRVRDIFEQEDDGEDELVFEVHVSQQGELPIWLTWQSVIIGDIIEHDVAYWMNYLGSVFFPIETLIDNMMNILQLVAAASYYLMVVVMVYAGVAP